MQLDKKKSYHKTKSNLKIKQCTAQLHALFRVWGLNEDERAALIYLKWLLWVLIWEKPYKELKSVSLAI